MTSTRIPFTDTPEPDGIPLLDLALEYAAILEPEWAERSAAIPAGTPRNEDPDLAGSGDGSGDGDGDGDGDGSGDGDGDGDQGLSRAEAERLRNQLNAAQKKARKLEQEKAAAKRKTAEEQGEYERLYNEEKDAHASTRDQIKTRALTSEVLLVAGRLKFKDPELARDLVKLNADEVVDDDFDVDTKVIESALKALAKKHKYMVEESREQSGSAGQGEGRRQDRGGRYGTPSNDGDGQQVRPRDRLRGAYADAESRGR